MLPEQRLFIAVITQSFLDACQPKPELRTFDKWVVKRRKRRAKRGEHIESPPAERAAYDAYFDSMQEVLGSWETNRNSARRWLLGVESGLETIARLAEFEIEYITRKAKQLERAKWVAPYDLPYFVA